MFSSSGMMVASGWRVFATIASLSRASRSLSWVLRSSVVSCWLVAVRVAVVALSAAVAVAKFAMASMVSSCSVGV